MLISVDVFFILKFLGKLAYLYYLMLKIVFWN